MGFDCLGFALKGIGKVHEGRLSLTMLMAMPHIASPYGAGQYVGKAGMVDGDLGRGQFAHI